MIFAKPKINFNNYTVRYDNDIIIYIFYNFYQKTYLVNTIITSLYFEYSMYTQEKLLYNKYKLLLTGNALTVNNNFIDKIVKL